MFNIVENLNESRKKNLEILPLKYSPTDLSPVISKATIDYHYEELAKGYAKRYNNNEGDSEFNYAGVFLHNIYFAQFQKSYADADFERKHTLISKPCILKIASQTAH